MSWFSLLIRLVARFVQLISGRHVAGGLLIVQILSSKAGCFLPGAADQPGVLLDFSFYPQENRKHFPSNFQKLIVRRKPGIFSGTC